MKNALQIFEEALRKEGYDGLFLSDVCACKLGDLIPCGEGPTKHCFPGVFVEGTCSNCCGCAPCSFHIGPKPREVKE